MPYNLGTASMEDNSSYAVLHQQLDAFLPAFAKRNGYRDILLVSTRNNQVVYSLANNTDFASSLENGPFAQTGLGTVYRDASALPASKVAWTDLSLYQPNFNEPSLFVAAPVMQQGDTFGVIVFCGGSPPMSSPSWMTTQV